jgi:hypothetical protein
MKNSSLTQAFSRLAIFLMVFGIAGSAVQLYAQRITGLPAAAVSVAEQDPNKPASELNHHLAGYALIAIGALVIAGYSSEKLRPLQLVWPLLFVAAGLFLAAWSDAEIWPRGNLSWRFLVHHDAEARLHKIYALLLMLIGIIEYLRARGKLNRFWRTWAFPLLALVGAGLLLFHDHGQTSGASSAEARQYMVSGLAARAADAPDSMPGMHHHASESDSPRVDDQVGTSTSAERVSDDIPAPHAHSASPHSHEMSEGMLRVERQHLWFAVIGLGVALFKFVSDSSLWRRSVALRLWPGFVTLLGVLLVFYTE